MKTCNNPQCPCHDGDPCHYRDAISPSGKLTKAMRKSPLRKVSTKQSKRNRALAALTASLIRRSWGQCEAMTYDSGHYSSRCQNRATDKHHKLARSQGGKDELSNLLHICRFCHNWINSNPKAAMAEGLVLKAGRA